MAESYWDLFAIGRRLQDKRNAIGKTQKEVSIATGLNLKTISNIESGQQLISTESLLKFCEYYHISADYILFGITLDEDSLYIRHKLNQLTRQQVDSIKAMLDAFTGPRF